MKRTVKFLLPALALALAACSSAPKRPDPTPLGPVPSILRADLAWKAEVGPVPSTFSAAAATDAVVVASSDGTVAAFDAANGARRWRAAVAGGIEAGVGSDGHFAAVVDMNNRVVSIGPQGQLLWRYQLPTSVITPPLVDAGRIVVQGADQRLWAFNAADGSLLWTRESRVPALLLQQASGMVVGQGELYVGGADGAVSSYHVDTGLPQWDATITRPRGADEIERVVSITGAPALAGNLLCARAYQSVVGCIDIQASRLAWIAKSDGDTGLSQNGEVVVGTQSDGSVRAWDATDGHVLWTNDHLRWRGVGAPLLVGETVAVGDAQGVLSFLSVRDGRFIGRATTGGHALASPLVAVGHTMVAVDRDGGIWAFVPQ